MECLQCYSGYRPNDGDKFCGFCGASLKSIEIFLETDNNELPPIYIDQQGPFELKIKVRNTGMVEYTVDTIKINYE